MKCWLIIFIMAVAWMAGAQPAAVPEVPVHEELRALRTNVLNAISSGDIERQLQFVHSNVVVTWQNSEVARGHQGLRDFYAKLGKNAFKGYTTPPTPDELTILHGTDSGVSFGESVAQYSLFGRSFEFRNRWTATLVKDNGRWQLASYHVSVNALDNPLINAAKRSLLVASGLAAVIGMILGIVIGRAGRHRAQAKTST